MEAVGVTVPAGHQLRAISFTCAQLVLTYRDSIKSAWWDKFEIGIAKSYANVETDWSNAGVVNSITNVSVRPEDNNTSATWGHAYINILSLLNGCDIAMASATEFYILIRNNSMTSGTLRFERISKNRDNGRDQTITVSGTLRKPLIQSLSATDNWGTSQTISYTINTNYVGDGKQVH